MNGLTVCALCCILIHRCVMSLFPLLLHFLLQFLLPQVPPCVSNQPRPDVYADTACEGEGAVLLRQVLLHAEMAAAVHGVVAAGDGDRYECGMEGGV